jgi:sarcosine oxidase subunit gamma
MDEDFPPRASAFGAWTGVETETLWAKPIEREGICVISARDGQSDALRQALASLYDLEPPQGLSCAANASTNFIATAPQTWMLIQTGAERTLAKGLCKKLGAFASITDQSGAYARLRLGGASAQSVLQKGVFLDLEHFGPGAAATTQIAHQGIILWRGSAALVFDLALFRSSARDFLHWLQNAARP